MALERSSNASLHCLVFQVLIESEAVLRNLFLTGAQTSVAMIAALNAEPTTCLKLYPFVDGSTEPTPAPPDKGSVSVTESGETPPPPARGLFFFGLSVLGTILVSWGFSSR